MEALAPDRRLAGRYVLDQPIATGGMAAVWRARDEVLARVVAVKILRVELARDPDFAERFHREAVAAAGLTHPGIIGVFDTGADNGVKFIVMEYASGRTLEHVLHEGGALEPEDAVALILPVLSALEFAHGKGLVHRDVKPANILVDDDGRVRVTDFGIAKAAFSDRDLTQTGQVLGTVRYLSPEQIQGDEVDPRSDVYSVGVILYELLTGRPPFQAETPMATAMMRLTRDPEPPRSFRPAIPRQLEAAVLQAMARRPADRFQSASAMLAALEPHSSGEPTLALAPAGPGRVGTGGRRTVDRTAPSSGSAPSVFRSWMLVPLVVVLLASAAIAGGLALGRLELGGPLGLKAAPQGPSGQAGGRVQALTISAAQDVDPQGNPPSEHPEDVGLAIDGDPATAWTTDHYSTARFGGLKEGLGLWLKLEGPATLTRVTVASPIAGWKFQLKAGDEPDPEAHPLPSIDGESTFTIGVDGTVTVRLDGVRTSGLLVWITTLGPNDGRFAAAVGEVKVLGQRE